MEIVSQQKRLYEIIMKIIKIKSWISWVRNNGPEYNSFLKWLVGSVSKTLDKLESTTRVDERNKNRRGRTVLIRYKVVMSLFTLTSSKEPIEDLFNLVTCETG